MMTNAKLIKREDNCCESLMAVPLQTAKETSNKSVVVTLQHFAARKQNSLACCYFWLIDFSERLPFRVRNFTKL